MLFQCKELLRPVKKWLSKLNAPEDAFDSQEDYEKEFEKCLLTIGDQIETVLKTKTSDDYQLYRHHLWIFVSKFTTKLTDSQLRKNYRIFVKKRNEEKSASDAIQKSSQYQYQRYHQYSQLNVKTRPTEQDETYRKAGWDSSSQPNNNRNTRNFHLKYASTMPLSKSSRSDHSDITVDSTNTGTASDYNTPYHHHHHHYHHRQFDRNRSYTSGNHNRRSYHDSTGDYSSQYRNTYHRDRDKYEFI